MIGTEDLREERPKHDERSKDAILGTNSLGVEGLLNNLGVKELRERDLVGCIAEQIDLVAQPRACTLRHRRPPCRTSLGSGEHPSLSTRRLSFLYLKSAKRL